MVQLSHLVDRGPRFGGMLCLSTPTIAERARQQPAGCLGWPRVQCMALLVRCADLEITGQHGGKLRSEISPWCVVVLNWYWNWVLDLVVKLVVWWCMT